MFTIIHISDKSIWKIKCRMYSLSINLHKKSVVFVRTTPLRIIYNLISNY